MYRLIKALNNNVALVKDEDEQQAVVMGLGLVFNKKKGDIIPGSKIEKIFSLRNDESKESFLLLLRDMPLDVIRVSYDLIDHLTSKYAYPVQDYLYITLTDHIFCSYQSLREGRYQRSQLPNLSDTYLTEYKMATEALEVLRDRLSNLFPDDEIGRIALHFLNAKGEDINVIKQDKNDRKTILTLVENQLKNAGISREGMNQNFYDRCMIHLTYLVNRLYDKEALVEERLDYELSNHIRENYHHSYNLASEILNTIENSLGVKANQEELIYLAIHLNKLLSKGEK
ncbi:PRD domain-containing protein [Streptococcus pluranimalium]|uniref:PRD domain-containing protein n=1 Tax=Streptococcus pluranimalium TaxID=82348 RepID=UPI0039FBC76E